MGDNYHCLNNLLVTHKNKIDIIYIDPPYNTGNSNLGYKDKFSKTSWLNFMKERMKLAHQLLKNDGIIFVSLDDNMQAYFKVMMDEIFGEENFISNLFWQSNSSVMKSTKFVRNDFEFILVYSKDKKNTKSFSKRKNEKMKFTNPDNDPKGNWFSSNATYKYDENSANTFEIKLPTCKKILRTWRFSKSEYLSGKISLYFNGDNVPRKKIYEKDYDISSPFSNFFVNFNVPEENLDSNFNYTESFSTGKNLLKSIIDVDFSTPKPIDLIKKIINLVSNKDAIILDFFAGSGTTGQAVLELNREDGGNRRFILNTLEFDEDQNIGVDICYERLFRINNGKTTNGNSNFQWIEKNKPFDESLEVYKIVEKDLSIGNGDTDLETIDFSIYNEFNPNLNINSSNACIKMYNLFNDLGDDKND